MNYDFYQILYKDGEKVFTDYNHTYEVYLRKNSEGKFPIYFNKGNLTGKKYFIGVFRGSLSGYETLNYDTNKFRYIKFTIDDGNKQLLPSRCVSLTNYNDTTFYSDSLFYELLYEFIDKVLYKLRNYRGKDAITECNT